MTCAKKRVTCTIQTINGDIYQGTNACNNPQVECPRVGDEGYEKCKTICDQPGHAEEIALNAALKADEDLTGATAYISGIGHYCKDCQHKLFGAGVESLRIMR